ncbi:MAG: DoxX family protein [Pseudomonadota bacterium]|nr:DoxX family protein [Pseudomonadota bacterium]
MSVLFIWAGFGKLMAQGATAAMMTKMGLPLPEIAMIVAIVIELGGGLLVLFGLLTQPTAVVLGIWCIITALVAHTNFADRNMEIHFMKNVAMAGGFAYMAAFGAGAISLDALFRRRRTEATVA